MRAACRQLAVAVAVATLAITTADTDWAKAVNQNIKVRYTGASSLPGVAVRASDVYAPRPGTHFPGPSLQGRLLCQLAVSGMQRRV